jgi:hypothetical protein
MLNIHLASCIALLSGATCKFYDDIVDIWKVDRGILLEGAQILLICFMTLFLIQDMTITLLFVAYTVICNLQGTADTVFWRAGGIVPLVAVCYHLLLQSQMQMQMSLPLSQIAFILLTAAGVYAESSTFPEEVSWKKVAARIALLPIFATTYYFTYDNPEYHYLSLIAGWTVGYNAISIGFQLQNLLKIPA